MKSTHQCLTVPVSLEVHPQADTLSIVKVLGGYTVCVRTNDWVDTQIGVFIPPDSIVDITRPEFAFLAGLSKNGKTARITVKKFRGIQSFGLLVPAPDGVDIGTDCAELLGVTHYEPEIEITMNGDNEQAPPELAKIGKYDIDTARKYSHCFMDGEEVFAFEKGDGSNTTYCWMDNRIWVKSRSWWKKESDRCPWWLAYHSTPSIRMFCSLHPGWRLHGEILGVQKLRYGFTPSNPGFAAFDIADPDGNYVDPQDFINITNTFNIQRMPLIYNGPWLGLDKMAEYAEGKTFINNADHIREGVVISPKQERWNEEVGRVKLKIVSFKYLESH